ncbi:hypothetical protein AB0H71_25340 [Nocardia sp. NPDC050697]|uniref:hypothetical protein n=1 Tax=Nocardia sp. NPDC050697 TaxID=3155158 RepID=UPI0033DEFD6E
MAPVDEPEEKIPSGKSRTKNSSAHTYRTVDGSRQNVVLNDGVNLSVPPRFRRLRSVVVTVVAVAPVLAAPVVQITTDFLTDARLSVDSCLSVVDPPGRANLGDSIELHAEVHRDNCVLRSAENKKRLLAQHMPTGKLFELKLSSDKEAVVVERGTTKKPMPEDGMATWSWAVRPSVAGMHRFAVVAIVYDSETDRMVDESDPQYFTVDAVPTNAGLISGMWNWFAGLPGVLAGVAALGALATGLLLRIRGQRTQTDGEGDQGASSGRSRISTQ